MADSLCHAGLNHPSNGQELNYIHILFDWDQEPDVVVYNLQASNQPSFNNIFLEIEEPTTVYIDKNNFTWNSTYYWKVRPIYNDGSYGSWSEISYFNIKQSVLTDVEVDIHNDELIQDGLIIYSQFQPNLTLGVIDQLGNEIWNSGFPNSDNEKKIHFTHK